MTLPWKTKSNRSISVMKDRISKLLYHYCKSTTVKFTNSGLSFSLFYSHFHFHFVLFSYFLFLEHRVRVSDSYESQDTENKVKRF